MPAYLILLLHLLPLNIHAACIMDNFQMLSLLRQNPETLQCLDVCGLFSCTVGLVPPAHPGCLLLFSQLWCLTQLHTVPSALSIHPQHHPLNRQTRRAISSPVSLPWTHSKENLFCKELEIYGMHGVQRGGRRENKPTGQLLKYPEPRTQGDCGERTFLASRYVAEHLHTVSFGCIPWYCMKK